MMQSIAIILICITASAGAVGRDAQTVQPLAANRSPMALVDHGSSAAAQSVAPDDSDAVNGFRAAGDDYASRRRSDQHGNAADTRTLLETSQAKNQFNAIKRINQTVMIETERGNSVDEHISGSNIENEPNYDAVGLRRRRQRRRDIRAAESQNVCNSLCECSNSNFLTIECTFDQVSDDEQSDARTRVALEAIRRAEGKRREKQID